MAFTFDQIFAADPSNPSNVAQNASITIFAPGDGTMTPLAITDPDGQPLANPIPVNANGFGSAFAHATLDRVAWAGGGFTGFFTSYEGMKNEAVAAKAAAEAAATDASASAATVLTGAEIDQSGRLILTKADATTIDAGVAVGAQGAKGDPGADGSNVLPTDTAIRDAINNPASETATALKAQYAPTVDMLTEAFTKPLYAAHRVGGNLVYPEQAMEGIAYSFEHGFAAEVDIQALADGTLVLCHDSTTDRTMTITGTVATKTVQEWKDARLKPILPGGKKYLAPFWEDVLNVYGGRGIFFAEIKTNDNTVAQKVIDGVVDRGLQGSVLILTFNSTHAMMAADAGLKVMYVTNDVAPATVATWGVVAISCSQTATQAYIESINAAGLKANVYGINTIAEANTRFGYGAWSITCDDPWHITGRFVTMDRDPYSKLESWPGQKNTNPAEFKFKPRPDGRVALYLKGNPGIRTPYFGAIPVNSRVFATIKFGTIGPSACSARLYFGTTKDQLGTNQESSTDNWYMMMIRRSGELALYKKVNGVGSTQVTGTGTANPVFPVLADGAAGADMQIQIDFLSTGIEVTNLTTGGKRVYADTSLAAPFYLNQSLGGGSPQPDGEFLSISRSDI